MTQLYLSHLVLNPENRQVQRDLGNRYDLHRTVMSGFPDDLPSDPIDPGFTRILYRLDQSRQTGQLALLVQSAVEPNWQSLRNDYLERQAAVKPLNPAGWRLETGRYFRFRLTANPTKRLFEKEPGKRHGKRVELYKEDDIRAWIKRRSEASGFAVQSVDIRPMAKIKGWKKRRPITVKSVTLDGILQIQSADTFTQALTNGIGPAKAFGCGLLSLAPA